MYGSPLPVATGTVGLAATGFYAGTAVVIGIVLLVVGLVLLRMTYLRRHSEPVHPPSR